MAAYNIQAKPSVHKDLRSLPKDLVTRIMNHIERLESTPIPKQDATLITIHYIRHRRDVYRALGSKKD